MPRFHNNRVDTISEGLEPRNSFEMSQQPSTRSSFGRSISMDYDSLNTVENEELLQTTQTVRRARSLHRNAGQNAVNFLPSRRIGTLGGKFTEQIGLLDTGEGSVTEEHRVQQIVAQMEKDDNFMEDSPNAEELRLDALRDMPQCLTVKRNIRAKISASVSRKSKHRPIGYFKRAKYRLSFWWKRRKQNFRNLIFTIELWYESIRRVEGHFGSGVATYFKFLRWLFIMNTVVSLFIIALIIIPQALYTSYSPEVVPTVPFHFLDILTGQGSFTNTTLFYGFYTNNILNVLTGQPFNIPQSYIFTMFFMYVAMFIALSISMARSYRKSFIEASGGMKNVFALKVFCGWDFGIASSHAATLKSKSIYNELRELLSDCAKSKTEHSCMSSLSQYAIKAVVNGFVLGLLGLTGFIMWTLMDDTSSFAPELIEAIRISEYRSILMAIIVTLIMIICPLIFSFMGRYEQYNDPRTSLFITLFRTFILEVVVVSMLCIFWLRSHNLCWETSLGQEVYRLIIFDFFFSLIAMPFFEFLRSIISRRCWTSLGVPEFDIARNTLLLIYNQTLLWMGLFYSPLLSVMVSLKMALLFYVKRTTIMRNCQPSSKSWRAAQTHTFFLVLIFMSLLVILLTMGYIFVSIPIGGCGPFKSYEFIYIALLEGILNIKEGNAFFAVIMYITKPGVVAFIMIGMSVGAYYLRAKSLAQKELVERLRQMLVLESKDKEYLLNAIANVTKGNWVYNQKAVNTPSIDTGSSSTWKYVKEDEKFRKPSNAGYQFVDASSPKRKNLDYTPRSSTSSQVFHSENQPSSSGQSRNYENVDLQKEAPKKLPPVRPRFYP